MMQWHEWPTHHRKERLCEWCCNMNGPPQGINGTLWVMLWHEWPALTKHSPRQVRPSGPSVKPRGQSQRKLPWLLMHWPFTQIPGLLVHSLMSEITRDMGDKGAEQWNWQNTCNCKCRNLCGKLVGGKVQMGRGLKEEVFKTVPRVGVLCACEAAPPLPKKKKKKKKKEEKKMKKASPLLVCCTSDTCQYKPFCCMPTGPVIHVNTNFSTVCCTSDTHQNKPLRCVPIRPVIPIQASLLCAYCTRDIHQYKPHCYVPTGPVIPIQASLLCAY